MTKDEYRDKLLKLLDKYTRKVEECHRLREKIKKLEQNKSNGGGE